jgi:hypothetical protein
MEQVKMSEIPDWINRANLQVEQNQCLKNAYLVSQNYSNAKIVDVVEGVIFLYYSDTTVHPVLHAWNKTDTVNFDVTAELLLNTKEESREILEIRYVAVVNCPWTDYGNGPIVAFSVEAWDAWDEAKRRLFNAPSVQTE